MALGGKWCLLNVHYMSLLYFCCIEFLTLKTIQRNKSYYYLYFHPDRDEDLTWENGHSILLLCRPQTLASSLISLFIPTPRPVHWHTANLKSLHFVAFYSTPRGLSWWLPVNGPPCFLPVPPHLVTATTKGIPKSPARARKPRQPTGGVGPHRRA